MYPMLNTCPNLAYAVGALGRHIANPGEDYKCALDHISQYLQPKPDSSPTSVGLEGLMLTSFIDVNWANKLSDCSLTSGYIYKLSGRAINWSSKKQSSITVTIMDLWTAYLVSTV
jgi:hypothetical protein